MAGAFLKLPGMSAADRSGQLNLANELKVILINDMLKLA
jgi:hypothetical protein